LEKRWKYYLSNQEEDKMETYIILLRGVMPFGKNKVPMADLRNVLAQAGLENVQTYIQTGNVIAQSDLSQSKLEKLVHDVIKEHIGVDITVIARNAQQFEDILVSNPFKNLETSKLYFTILASIPDENTLNNFLSIDFYPDQVVVIGDVLYTLYTTKYSDSKFNNNFFENKLQARATTRNFNTMTKLAHLGKKQTQGN
jgi:uncharacterized protein (DUF1697 family)